MKKSEFYLKAMQNRMYSQRAWVISAFSIIREDFSAWKSNPTPYRIVQSNTGFMFVDPVTKTLQPIEDAPINEPLFKFLEPIEVLPEQIPNLNNKIVTTYGNVLFNYICLIENFGTKMQFITGKCNIGKIEDEIAKRLEDNPIDGIRDNSKIHIDELIKFVNSTLYLTEFSQLSVWGSTEKTLVPPPGIFEFKKKLLEEYKDKLSDPSIIAKINSELSKFDAEYTKDDPGQSFLNDGKNKKARSKKFLILGAEAGFDDKNEMDLVQNSLYEGWPLDKFPTLNNTLRAGSFNRGAETMLGGDAVKWLFRASSNIKIATEDCGTRVGKQLLVTKENLHYVNGYNLIENDSIVPVDSEEQASTYLGKLVKIRTPLYCSLDKTDFCRICCGKKLSINPTGISLAVAEYGSTMMLISMKAIHGKILKTTKLDIANSLF